MANFGVCGQRLTGAIHGSLPSGLLGKGRHLTPVSRQAHAVAVEYVDLCDERWLDDPHAMRTVGEYYRNSGIKAQKKSIRDWRTSSPPSGYLRRQVVLILGTDSKIEHRTHIAQQILKEMAMVLRARR